MCRSYMGETMNKLNAVILYVSDKTKGITLEGAPNVWYNPTAAIKDKVTTHLKGKRVILEVDDKRIIYSITIDGNNQPMNKDDFFKNKEERELKRDARVGWSANLNTAISIMKIAYENSNALNLKSDKLKEEAYKLAQEIHDWIETKV